MTHRSVYAAAWHPLTKEWGSRESVALYLDRCQVDTPLDLVKQVWARVLEHRESVTKVIDFGAGDARFARSGRYGSYIGYEVDPTRCGNKPLPDGAQLIQQCAFAQEVSDASLATGNPPFVRNQDLPSGWRQVASNTIARRTGVELSGLANAWQYFFMLALASTLPDGLIALVVPYEWVSRPSARALREYIQKNRWDVWVYRLGDDTFDRVLTTSSITIVDKRSAHGRWHYLQEKKVAGTFRALASASGGRDGVIRYAPRVKATGAAMRAKRGLSPGTQKLLTLTEGERVRSGLKIGDDVVPCITTLRYVDTACTSITEAVFKRVFRLGGLKCWLIRTDRKPSARLRAYLDAAPTELYQTATCLNRDHWWAFVMPKVPDMLAATGFRARCPKVVINRVGAHAVGSVSGIYGVAASRRKGVVAALQALDLSRRVVAHSNGLKKLEINQLNTVLRLLDSQIATPV